MIKTLLFAAAAVSLAGTAVAQSVTVRVAGDNGAVRRQIVAAAHDVCVAQFWRAPLAYYAVPSCIRATLREAEAQLHAGPIVASADVAAGDAAATVR